MTLGSIRITAPFPRDESNGLTSSTPARQFLVHPCPCPANLAEWDADATEIPIFRISRFVAQEANRYGDQPANSNINLLSGMI